MAQVNVVQAFIAQCNRTAEIFAAFSNRITADFVPDGQALPYARVREATSRQTYHFKGEAGRFAAVQVDVYGSTPSNAYEASEVIRSAFSGHSGLVGTLNAGMCTVNVIYSNLDPDSRNHLRILEVEIPTND